MSRDATPAEEALPPGRFGFKIMTLRHPDRCSCGNELKAGARAGWDRSRRTVHCLPCVTGATGVASADGPVVGGTDLRSGSDSESAAAPSPIDVGEAGGSARAEFASRRARHAAKVRTAHPRIGGFLLAVSQDRQSIRAWQSGADGERRLGDRLTELGGSVIALHDRRLPGTRANIDHVIVGPAGVYVIDAKRYRNAKVAVRKSGGLFTLVRQQLMIAGRDKTTLAAAMSWQVAAVRTALAGSEFADVPIIAALCFIDADLLLLGSSEVGDVRVLGIRGTAKLVTRAGSLDSTARDRLARRLAGELPASPST